MNSSTGLDTSHQTIVDLYPIDNYSFGEKAPLPDKDRSVAQRFQRMEHNYKKEGMRRTIDGVCLVHNHGHPHILLLQLGNNYFKLPGGKLRPEMDEHAGLKSKLTSKLSPAIKEMQRDWQIGEIISTWWRPHFDPNMYPYLPPHVTKPRECKKVFIIPLPDSCSFAVPSNFKLVAVPLFELYDNESRYGCLVASLPELLSKFHFVCH
eukprot:91927_1